MKKEKKRSYKAQQLLDRMEKKLNRQVVGSLTAWPRWRLCSVSSPSPGAVRAG